MLVYNVCDICDVYDISDVFDVCNVLDICDVLDTSIAKDDGHIKSLYCSLDNNSFIAHQSRIALRVCFPCLEVSQA